MNANLQVNMGDGLSSYFHGSLPVSQVITTINVPQLAAGSGGTTEYSFTVPADIQTPMLYLLDGYRQVYTAVGDVYSRYYYYFTQVSGTTWKCVFYGVYLGKNRDIPAWDRSGENYLVPATAKILIGGWRG